tara:strand:+ start:237 stop:569 length:333 start_codon:yes stop_codon:yes gene_type:complete
MLYGTKDIAFWGSTYSFTTKNGKKYNIQKKYTYCNREVVKEIRPISLSLGKSDDGDNERNNVEYIYGINCTFNGTIKYLSGYRDSFKKVINCSEYNNEFCNAAKKFGLIN